MKRNNEILEELAKAYWDEIETVMNYLSSSKNLDGIPAEELKESLSKEVDEEMGHAKKLSKRIKELSGTVPGSFEFRPSQASLQPPEETTDIEHVINGVIEAEENAIKRYKKIIALCEGDDYVTQELAISILGDEESHKSLFEGFKKEFELKAV